LLTQHEPKKGVAGGGGLLFRMNFLGVRERYALVPYIDYGMGMVSLDFDLRDQDDGSAFTLLVGFDLTGLREPWSILHPHPGPPDLIALYIATL